jgi:heat shock protein HslJ
MTRILRIKVLLPAIIILAGCSTSKKMNLETIQTENTSLTETYWRLTELKGDPVLFSDGQKKEMHLILKKDGNLVNGHGGCNSFRAIYKLQDGTRLSFSQIAGTLMACENMQKESEFLETLQKVDNYTILGKVLSLQKAKLAPLAKFEAVYMN